MSVGSAIWSFAKSFTKTAVKDFSTMANTWESHDGMTLDELKKELSNVRRSRSDDAESQERVLVRDIGKRKDAIKRAEQMFRDSKKDSVEILGKTVEVKPKHSPTVEAARNILQKLSKEGSDDASNEISRLKQARHW